MAHTHAWNFPSAVLTFFLQFLSLRQEVSGIVWRDCKWYTCGDLHGVDTNSLSILKASQHGHNSSVAQLRSSQHNMRLDILFNNVLI